MSDPTDDHPTDAAPHADAPPGVGMPRWAKVSIIVVGGIVALLLVLKVAGVGGEHGPGRHMPGGESRHQPMDHPR